MIFGYARVSTQEQNLDRQLDTLENEGAEEIVQEKVRWIKYNRPEKFKRKLTRHNNAPRKIDVYF